MTPERQRASAAASSAAEVVLTDVRIFQELLPGALEAIAAQFQHEAAAGDGGRLLRVLLPHHDRRSLPADGQDRLEYDVHHARVEAERGLVHHEQARMQEEG